ncbi:hypothetical protein K438DRAFT_1620994 [Mycena galopus ATCC 62051]|nr:hypothetical protein K438DRAFT_1620994 [Mycena galopus ATCC 62051]
MHSAGERQFYVIALIETLFQHLPLKIRVGLLYDIGCAFERSCLKWDFLSRFLDRIAFAVSVFHAFGHEWACQLLYHPRKRLGFGFTNGESAERFWNSIRHLIAHLRICGYHNRLYTLDAQIEHSQEGSLFRLGEWIRRRYRHCVAKRAESTKALRECEKSTALLREQWQLQVVAQTKPLPRTWAFVAELRKQFLSAVDDDDDDAAVFQLEYDQGLEALKKARTALRRKEEALGVDEHEELEQLANSEYMRLRMNARALKLRLRERLRARKFEMDVVERSYRRLLNDSKLHAHTESAVKRRAPTIVKLAAEYNKLCTEIAKIIKNGGAPRGSIAPVTIPPKGLWQLDVDDAIFQDVGLDDRYGDDGDDNPPLWLSDDNVRKGINAVLQLDRCDEEERRLRRENSALRVWFRQEWEIVTKAIEGAGDTYSVSDVDKYHLQLHQDRLVKLAATWDKHLPDFGEPSTPWGPSLLQLSRCRVDAHLAARGEDRHYREEEDDGDDGEESGGEDDDFGTLDAVERADMYRMDEQDYY